MRLHTLTLALASTCAEFLKSILMMSVWLALAARWRGVSPLIVRTSGQASCCSKSITIFILPIKLATCKGDNPDWKESGINIPRNKIKLKLTYLCSIFNAGLVFDKQFDNFKSVLFTSNVKRCEAIECSCIRICVSVKKKLCYAIVSTMRGNM